MTDDEVALLDTLRTKCGLKRGPFIRQMSLSEERLIVLEGYTEIVRVISELDGKISPLLISERCVSETEEAYINSRLNQIVSLLLRIDSQLTEIHESEEEQ